MKKKKNDDTGKDRKDENSKGHTWLQRKRTDMMTARRTSMTTDVKKGHNDKEKEDRHYKK